MKRHGEFHGGSIGGAERGQLIKVDSTLVHHGRGGLLGTLRSTTTVDENVNSKYNFASAQVFCDYSISFTSYNPGDLVT